jgi:FYVE zinc finger
MFEIENESHSSGAGSFEEFINSGGGVTQQQQQQPTLAVNQKPRINRASKPPDYFAQSEPALQAQRPLSSNAAPPPKLNRSTKPENYYSQNYSEDEQRRNYQQQTININMNSMPAPSSSSASVDSDQDLNEFEGLSESEARDKAQAEVRSFVEHLQKFKALVRSYTTTTPSDREALELNANGFDLKQHAEYVRAVLDDARPFIDQRLHMQLAAQFEEAASKAEGIVDFADRRAKKRFTMTTDPKMSMAIERQQIQIQALAAQKDIAFDERWTSMEPLLEGGQLFEYTDDDMIAEQNMQMQALAQETEALREVYVDHAVEVNAQGEQLQYAELQVQQTEANVQEGVHHIVKAQKSKKYRGLTLGSAVVCGIVGGAAGVMLGPAGIVAGAAAGAAVGGFAGHQGGKAIRRKQDRDAFKITLDKKWVHDKDAPNCYCCRVKFSTIVRRHHCRSCGEVLCSKCSSKKIKLPDSNWDSKTRVCDRCYDHILHSVGAVPGDATFNNGGASAPPIYSQSAPVLHSRSAPPVPPPSAHPYSQFQ